MIIHFILVLFDTKLTWLITTSLHIMSRPMIFFKSNISYVFFLTFQFYKFELCKLIKTTKKKNNIVITLLKTITLK